MTAPMIEHFSIIIFHLLLPAKLNVTEYLGLVKSDNGECLKVANAWQEQGTDTLE